MRNHIGGNKDVTCLKVHRYETNSHGKKRHNDA